MTPRLDPDQIGYLRTQRLGRLATVDTEGAPQVNPVSVYYNDGLGTIDIGGRNMVRSRKYRNVRRGSAAAVVVDDLDGPNGIRCLEIRGRAEAIPAPTDSAARTPGAIIRITPMRVISWGISTRTARSDA